MKKIILIAAAVIILGVGVALATTMVNNNEATVDQISRDTSGSSSDANTPDEETASPAAGTELAVRTTIIYTNNGFDKGSYTVGAGEGIEVKNNSSRSLDFASDDHPIHTDNSELNIGTVPAGQTKTFTIEEAGEWGFHNHAFASHEGTITVQ